MVTRAEKKEEDWITSKWRPMMAITYMATITTRRWFISLEYGCYFRYCGI